MRIRKPGVHWDETCLGAVTNQDEDECDFHQSWVELVCNPNKGYPAQCTCSFPENLYSCVVGEDCPEERKGYAHAAYYKICLLYTSDAADEEDSVDLGGRRIIKKKKKKKKNKN